MTVPRIPLRLSLVATAVLCVTLPQVARSESPRLADAAQNRKWATVQSLIEAGSEVDAKQVDGMRALHWAIHFDQTLVTDQLLEAGASANDANRYGVTPLSIACLNGNAQIVKALLAAKADPNAALPGGETPLMTAARNGNRDVVSALLDAGANVNARVGPGQTALMWAAAEGHVAVVETLLDGGADHDRSLNSGFNALAFAVREGNQGVVLAILKRGADVNQIFQPKRTTPKSLRKGSSPLILAIENGHFDLAVELLKRGSNPNDQRSGFAPLHVLTWVRKPNRGDGADGMPPPKGSGRRNSLQFLDELVARGADVNLQLKRGDSGRGKLSMVGATPLLMASKTADLPMMKQLVKLGADPRRANADGSTPLMAAAGLGTRAPFEEAGTEAEALAAVEWLLELGAEVDTRDKNGETAMHGAAYKNLAKMVELLDRRGATIDIWNQRNRYGWTPLLIAEGHRPGNFKPSFETIAAIHRVMRKAGLTPPPPTPRKKRIGY